jgi:proteasome lid subunit RPN8/RPN11
MLEDIEKHFESEYPREGCGVIGVVKGKKRWFPCKNVAEGEDDFVMCSEDWFRVRQQADIIAIVHSHPDSSNEASQADINNCNALQIPYWIFSYPDMNVNIIEPETLQTTLIGREYEFGVRDCFEAARDWLIEKADITIPLRAPFEDDWWEKDLDYFTEERIKEWGLVKVNDAKEHDILVFQVEANVSNHCGVYLGNDIFFHHAVNRLSCRESLYPFWAKHIVGIYRYEA